MRAVRYQVPFFDAGAVVYEPGKLYTVTPETTRAVATLIAVYVDVSDHLVPRKMGGREIYELVEPVDEGAVLRARIAQARAEASAKSAEAEQLEQQLATLPPFTSIRSDTLDGPILA